MSGDTKIANDKSPGLSRRNAFASMLLLPLFWLCMWLVSGDAYGLPGGVLFALCVLFGAARAAGSLVQLVGLPPLFGMLVVGFTLRVISDVVKSNVFVVNGAWSASLRSISLVVILTRAGLGLDLANLYKLSASVLRLAAIPNILEATTDAILAHVILRIPWLWAFMLGFVVSAVSPAVVVPSLLRLKDMRYGTEKGIPDLVLAAASFDDVLSISGFGICLGLVFTDGSTGLAWDIMRGPVELLTGIFLGMIIGLICGYLGQYLPTSPGKNKSQSQPDYMHLTTIRICLVMGFGCCAVFGGMKLHFTGAGALAVIIGGVTCKQMWSHGADNGVITGMVGAQLKEYWKSVAEPLLFVLIGASVSVTFLDGTKLGQSLLILVIGLCVRLLMSILCVFTNQFTSGERLFISMAWLPKATVQAAIGAVALDAAKTQLTNAKETYTDNSTQVYMAKESVEYVQSILTIAVLSILVTAPIGAALIAVCGPRLLSKEQNREDYSHGIGRSENDPNVTKLENKFDAELTSVI